LAKYSYKADDDDDDDDDADDDDDDDDDDSRKEPIEHILMLSTSTQMLTPLRFRRSRIMRTVGFESHW